MSDEFDSHSSTQHIGPPSGPMSLSGGAGARRGPRSPLFLTVTLGAALLAFAGLLFLGTWQLERRVWKLDLIARVDARVHAPAVAAPPPSQWARVNARDDEYRHVRVSGRLLNAKPTYVAASTIYGSGYWLIVPLLQADGSIVLINRGFVSSDKPSHRVDAGDASPNNDANVDANADTNQAASVTLTGLLRMTEPHGTRLRSNEPEADRWFSRDVQAIAAKRQLTQVAPYFIDVDAAPTPPGKMPAEPAEPIGGLTVISFYNHHLVYAITWYTLALMVAAAAVYLIREEQKLRHSS